LAQFVLFLPDDIHIVPLLSLSEIKNQRQLLKLTLGLGLWLDF
jgi:hypothetical protein